jgi:hypothetical protein
LVETFVGGEGTDETVATTKAVLNIIDRHIVGFSPEGGGDKPESNFLLFTSSGVRLPLDVQNAFTSAGYRIHCHDSDDFGYRLHREKLVWVTSPSHWLGTPSMILIFTSSIHREKRSPLVTSIQSVGELAWTLT